MPILQPLNLYPNEVEPPEAGTAALQKKSISVMRMDRLVAHPSFDGAEPLPDALDQMLEAIRDDSMGSNLITAEDKVSKQVATVHYFQY